MPLMKMDHENDPKQELLNSFSEVVKNISLAGPSVLVAVYKRPLKTQKGLILTENYRDEDIYQGKIGLILKMGSYPFDEEDKKFFGDKRPEVGDWVMFRVSDGMSLVLGNREGHCRLFSDRRTLKMFLGEPDLVW